VRYRVDGQSILAYLFIDKVPYFLYGCVGKYESNCPSLKMSLTVETSEGQIRGKRHYPSFSDFPLILISPQMHSSPFCKHMFSPNNGISNRHSAHRLPTLTLSRSLSLVLSGSYLSPPVLTFDIKLLASDEKIINCVVKSLFTVNMLYFRY
jgi:hypothetical protein